MLDSDPRFAPADCFSRVHSGEAVMVDVREPAEWATGVANSARLLPLGDQTVRRVRLEWVSSR